MAILLIFSFVIFIASMKLLIFALAVSSGKEIATSERLFAQKEGFSLLLYLIWNKFVIHKNIKTNSPWDLNMSFLTLFILAFRH